MDRIRDAAPPRLEGVPGELVAVLRRALEKNPLDRFPSSRTLRAALQASGPVADELALADHLASLREQAPASSTTQTRIDTAG